MKKIVVAGVVSAVLALVVGAGAGWGVWHHYAGKGKPTAAAQTETVETLDESKSVFVTLPETIVTLHDNNGADHYLSAELVMVVASDKEAEKIKHQEPLYQSIAAIFIAQLYGIDLSIWQEIILVLTLMVTSKGIAGVPGVSFVVLLATLGSVGIPLEGLAFIAGVDRILDMARTALNVVGNALAVLVIAKWEHKFDRKKALAQLAEAKQGFLVRKKEGDETAQSWLDETEAVYLPDEKRYYRGPDAPLPDLSDVTALLAQAKALHDELEAIYNPHVDFARVYALANSHALRLFKEN